MEEWFSMKFYEDMSDIRPEVHGYYKHHVHHFVTHFFSRAKIKGKKILDFGCGPGFYSVILAQRGAQVVGIDQSAFLINKANEYKNRLKLNNVKFINADFLKYSSTWNTAEFDYVIAIDTMVSFDYCMEKHQHNKVSKAFSGVNRILKDDGKLFIIESHPFWGRILGEVPSETGEYYCLRSQHYKIEYKQKDDPHHWFTLDEMTKATSENGMAVLRIYEPEPSNALKKENPDNYLLSLKYPEMIVYEICKISLR